MAEIKWEAPPPGKRGGNVPAHGDIFEALRKRPGEWAIFAEDAPASVVTHIKQGRYAGSASGEFDAVFRNGPNPDRRGRIYVRYVGGAA